MAADSHKSLRCNGFFRGTHFPCMPGRGGRRGPAASGFTLIEILVVLTLVSILASAAGPAFGAYVGRLKTRNALNQIATDLAYARMAAVRSGNSSSVRFVRSSVYQISVTGAAVNPLRAVSLEKEYAGIVVEAPVAALTFNSRGLLTGGIGRGYIVVRMGTLRDSLAITPAGRVYRGF